jgi:hypothetical protein
MAIAIIIILCILLGLGVITIPGLIIKAIVLAHINGHTITLWDVLVFFVILWATDALPSPLREICAMLLLLWTLSIFGVIAIAGFGNIMIIAVIVGLIISVLRK